jgi:hypothetical protein
MSARHVLAAFGLLLPPQVAIAAEIQDFFGEWRGVEVSIDGPSAALEADPADLAMVLAGHDRGFRLQSFALAREPDGGIALGRLDATFAPTETPGVFAYQSARGSLLSRLFADPSVGNPLEGDTLIWARLQEDTLHVYSLAIDDRGGFALEHSTKQLTKDGIVTRSLLRQENEQIVELEGLFERAGD